MKGTTKRSMDKLRKRFISEKNRFLSFSAFSFHSKLPQNLEKTTSSCDVAFSSPKALVVFPRFPLSRKSTQSRSMSEDILVFPSDMFNDLCA